MVKIPFVPPKLPPKIDYTALITHIGRAHRAIGTLSGLLVSVRNLDLFITPLLTKEAVLSSRIEGTQATLEDVLRYEAEEKISEKDEKEKDIREIINYRQAIHAAMEELKDKPIGENLIKKVHYVLLDSVRGSSRDRGNLRRIQVFVGPPGATIEQAKYIPPPFTELPSLLSNWENYVNSEDEQDPLVQIGVAHYQFEAIHPFMDGNGRIGRLLIPLFLYQRRILQYPLLYVSEYFEEEKGLYYDLLNRVDEHGDWLPWLGFFLNALGMQATKTQMAVSRMIMLYEQLKAKITSINSIYALKLLDIIFATPVVSFATIKKRLGAKSNQTIYNLLDKFKKIGILDELLERKRGRTYGFTELIEILRKGYEDGLPEW